MIRPKSIYDPLLSQQNVQRATEKGCWWGTVRTAIVFAGYRTRLIMERAELLVTNALHVNAPDSVPAHVMPYWVIERDLTRSQLNRITDLLAFIPLSNKRMYIPFVKQALLDRPLRHVLANTKHLTLDSLLCLLRCIPPTDTIPFAHCIEALDACADLSISELEWENQSRLLWPYVDHLKKMLLVLMPGTSTKILTTIESPAWLSCLMALIVNRTLLSESIPHIEPWVHHLAVLFDDVLSLQQHADAERDICQLTWRCNPAILQRVIMVEHAAISHFHDILQRNGPEFQALFNLYQQELHPTQQQRGYFANFVAWYCQDCALSERTLANYSTSHASASWEQRVAQCIPQTIENASGNSSCLERHRVR